MNLIAIESSSSICGVSLFIKGKIKDTIEIEKNRVHAKFLPVFLNDIILKNNISVDEIDGVAISSGPGSYTGLRIGMSLAKGFSFSKNIPIVPIPTLESMNLEVKQKGHYYILLHSHKDIIFSQLFQDGEKLNKPESISFKQLKNYEKWGYDLGKLSQNIKYNEIKPSSANIGKLALLNFDRLATNQYHEVNPEYITNIKFKKLNDS
tara:strand:+ start:1503 stop:2123 length:621 start_codon:yes stop_codon:yes gene_type:complete